MFVLNPNSRSSDVVFGRLETFATFPTDNSVYVLLEDILNPGYLLAAMDNSIVSLSPAGEMLVLAGSTCMLESGFLNDNGTEARFSGIRGLVQLPYDGSVLVSDSNNHCIRRFDRNSSEVTTYSGSCTNAGQADGSLEKARFRFPTDLEFRDSNTLMVVEPLQNKLRYIYIKFGFVSSATFDHQLSHLLKGSDYFYITVNYGVVEVVDDAPVWIAGSTTQGSNDGSLMNASFKEPQDTIMLESGLLMVADRSSHKLRLLNLSSDIVTSLCSGHQGHLDGNLTVCQLDSPYSLLVMNETLYIGETGSYAGGIRRIKFYLNGKSKAH